MKAGWLGLAALLLAGPVLAKSRNLPPIEAGWERLTHLQSTIGVVDIRKEGPFIVDKRSLDPTKSLEACRAYAAKPDPRTLDGWGCELFNYPSNRNLPQAREALEIYERQFAIAASPGERVAIANKNDLGLMWELQQHGSADVLNSFVPSNGDGQVATLAEMIAYQNSHSPALIQWLYDRGARLCESDAPLGGKRFSCIQFYLQAGSTRSRTRIGGIDATPLFFETLDVLERNGFRPNSTGEIEAAVTWSGVAGEISPGQRRYFALLSQADARRVQDLANQRRAERQSAYAAEQRATQERERQSLIRSTGGRRRPDAENRVAVQRLAIRGETVCQIFTENGTSFMFRAVVEGNSATRLQLRASSIRSSASEITNYPYGDTRINPGTVFWDDAANWGGNC